MNNPLRRLIPAVWPCSKTNRTRARRQLSRAVAACAFERLEERQLLSLTMDIRLAGGGNALTITDSMVGQPIQMEIWARAIGSLPGDPGYADVANEGTAWTCGSILSTNDPAGGATRGNLSSLLDPFYGGLGGQNGTPTDLDNDTDLDIGSNNDADAPGFVYARHDPVNDGALLTYGNPILDGQGRRIGTEQRRSLSWPI